MFDPLTNITFNPDLAQVIRWMVLSNMKPPTKGERNYFKIPLRHSLVGYCDAVDVFIVLSGDSLGIHSIEANQYKQFNLAELKAT